jgi:hypothetical protein
MSDIIIPATMSSDYPISEPSDPFVTDIIQNSFPLSTENKVSEEGNTFDYLELSPNKKYALWRRDMVEYWNLWWRQVLYTHPELQTGSSSTTTMRRHYEHKKYGGSITGQGVLSKFGVSG